MRREKHWGSKFSGKSSEGWPGREAVTHRSMRTPQGAFTGYRVLSRVLCGLLEIPAQNSGKALPDSARLSPFRLLEPIGELGKEFARKREDHFVILCAGEYAFPLARNHHPRGLRFEGRDQVFVTFHLAAEMPRYPFPGHIRPRLIQAHHLRRDCHRAGRRRVRRMLFPRAPPEWLRFPRARTGPWRMSLSCRVRDFGRKFISENRAGQGSTVDRTNR